MQIQRCRTAAKLLPGVVLWVMWCALAYGQNPEGSTYYTYSLDIMTGEPFHCRLAFSGSDDNATADNGTRTGTLTLSIENQEFDNATGSFVSAGRFFSANWEAAQAVYRPYYEETRYTFYSFLMVGTTVFDDGVIAGVAHNTITEQSVSQGTVGSSGYVPFVGLRIGLPGN